MATGNIKGLLGPICLVILVIVAGAVAYLGRSPETAHLVAASPDRHDPTTTLPSVAASLGIAVAVIAVVAVWKMARRK